MRGENGCGVDCVAYIDFIVFDLWLLGTYFNDIISKSII